MYTLPDGKVLVLRTCKADMSSPSSNAHGFRWPESGTVEAPDWDPVATCGYGLHGALWGEGNGAVFCWDNDTRWLVVEVDADLIVVLDGKVKFPHGIVVFCGDRCGATEFIAVHIPKDRSYAIIGGTSTSGDHGTSTSGDHGTSTSGDDGTSTSGDDGTSTSGHHGTSTSGDDGTSISGDGGTSTSGDGGTSTSGHHGTSTSGDGGCLIIRWWDDFRQAYRLSTAEVGKNGIKADKKYRLNDSGEFISHED